MPGETDTLAPAAWTLLTTAAAFALDTPLPRALLRQVLDGTDIPELAEALDAAEGWLIAQAWLGRLEEGPELLVVPPHAREAVRARLGNDALFAKVQDGVVAVVYTALEAAQTTQDADRIAAVLLQAVGVAHEALARGSDLAIDLAWLAGDMLARLGDTRAEPLLAAVVAADTGSAEETLSVAGALVWLGAFAAARGDRAQGGTYYARAVTICASRLGPDHWITQDTRATMLRVLGRDGWPAPETA
jgi:hypothetical protein